MRKLISLIILVGVALLLFAPMVHAEETSAHCFDQDRSGKATSYPDGACTYDGFKNGGFVMDGLPNPLTIGHCYFWADQSDITVKAQDIPCNDPKIAGAVPIDSTILPCPHLDGDICVSKQDPNCFTPDPVVGYIEVSCTQAFEDALGTPLSGGFCYVSESPTKVEPTNCDAVKQKVVEAYQAKHPQATPAPTTAQADTSIPSETQKTCDGSTPDKLKACLDPKNNSLVGFAQDFINFLGVGVGVIVVIMIIMGGIQYTTAGNNPKAVGAAKKRILNAVIALAAFLVLYSFMQWLVPGGIF